MTVAPSRPRVSYADYLAIEARSGARHEYVDGVVEALAGGSARHARLGASLGRVLGNLLGDGPCQPYSSDLRLRVPATHFAGYPDLSVICGDPEAPADDRHAAINPVLIVEVLSESTERWDRGGKFFHYQQLPSLTHYLLVSQDAPRIEHFQRQPDGSWRYQMFGPGEAVHLSALGVALPVDAVFQNLPPA